ncbi:superoxide dismutase family protein [Pseudoxanthomonas koreensis]|uniref:superoxide dismutase family protein n=1 Tax=Pseudoxanthomonas koreensis TaxID=266061 RepID=UPI001390F857|nr:superoxide dismutase family protein [Pseudoxanthomonas koreensis]KAF1693576.1 superoxide dismutase [Pseudoxanthomonas koreensis]
MRIAHASLGLLTLATLAACSSTPPASTSATPAATSTAQQATAVLASASGSRVSGKLTLAPMGDGVHLSGEVGGLAPNGQFGFHVHEKGDCSAVDATSAGAHFNPAASAHGRASTAVHHAGDMDNIASDGSGVAKVNVHLRGVTLGGGAANDIANRAVIVHAAPDDYHTQPTGNAGARLACGVIKVTR